MEEEIKKLMQSLEAAQNEAKEARDKVTTLETSLIEKDKTSLEEKKEAEEKIKNLDESISELKSSIAKLIEKKESKDIYSAFEKAIYSDDFKKAISDVRSKSRDRVSIEVKVDTSAATGTIGRSMVDNQIDSTQQQAIALYDRTSKFPIPDGKSTIVWPEGSFTENTDYIDEATDQDTSSTGSVEEKTRGLAKIQTKLPFTEELSSDLGYFLSWLKSEAIQAIRNKVDTEILIGAGADTSAATKKKIYGVVSQGSTAFDASKAGLTSCMEDADIYSLLLAMQAQVTKETNGQYQITDIYINPSDMKYINNLRDKNLNSRVFDKGMLGNVRFNESNKITAGSCLGLSANTIRLHEKRSFEIEIVRKADTDSYVMFVRWRGQEVVTASRKKANIYVSNIDTAIASIASAGNKLTLGNVGISALASTSATISWPASTGATGYKVSTDNVNWGSAQTELTTSLSSLSASTAYTYYVKAVGSGKTDSDSKSVTFTTPAA